MKQQTVIFPIQSVFIHQNEFENKTKTTININNTILIATLILRFQKIKKKKTNIESYWKVKKKIWNVGTVESNGWTKLNREPVIWAPFDAKRRKLFDNRFEGTTHELR